MNTNKDINKGDVFLKFQTFKILFSLNVSLNDLSASENGENYVSGLDPVALFIH